MHAHVHVAAKLHAGVRNRAVKELVTFREGKGG